MTKNNPGKYDCYANAEPDEPMFVLLARDPAAPLMVLLWARLREECVSPQPIEDSKIFEARDCANAMRKWMAENRPNKSYDAMETAFAAVISDIVADSINNSFNTSADIL